MKFYDRETELTQLNDIEVLSRSCSQMTVMTGRRRIGKTKLLLRSVEGREAVFFFVSKKSEAVLCQQFVEEAERSLGVPIGRYASLPALLEHLMRISESRPFTVIIDEFQELEHVNSSVFGDIQRVWDLNKDKSCMNLLVSGSVYSMMHHIFQDEKEPLFSRATAIINLKPFRTDVLKQILGDHNPKYSKEDLLALYMFSGGVAWYVELLMNAGATTYQKMVNYVFRENSLFLTEGKNLLVEEFGREYGVYFSIMECIARGINTRSEIESMIGLRDIGGYIVRLERDYGLIGSRRPLLTASGSKCLRYRLTDNFLTFWFRFIYKYNSYLESGSIGLLKSIFERDYHSFSDVVLERYFWQKAIESGSYTHIGNYWDRKGGNEIDLILLNEIDETIDVCEVKRKANNISLGILCDKAEHYLTLHPQLRTFKLTHRSLSMEDM